MKKILLLFLILFLAGCTNVKNESAEIKLCNKLDEYFSKYDSKQISFDNLVVELDTLKTEYCTEENKTCSSIETIKQFSNQSYELKDCSIYPEGSFKDACESGNKLIQDSIDKKESLEIAYISDLKRNCNLARE